MVRQSSILVLTQFYWPEPIGSGPPVASTAEILADKFSKVTVFTTLPHYPRNEIFPGYETGDHDIERHRNVAVERFWTVPAKGGGLVARAKSEVAFFIGLLWRAIVGPMPKSDVILTVCPSILTVLAGALYSIGGRRHVCIVHDIQSGLADGLKISGGKLITSSIRAIERFAFNRTNALIVLNQSMRDELIGMGVKREIMVIPPLFDIQAVTPRKLPTDRRTYVLYSGNLGQKQGLEQVLQAAALLQERRPEIRFVIRGDGSQRTPLLAMAAKLGLGNVSFGDLVPPDRLAEELAASAVHLVPQKPEGARFAMPSKVFAIMAAGRPAICTASENSPLHALMGETGAITCSPPNDAEALCAQVIRLIEDSSLANEMGQRGRAYVERVFSPASYRATLEEVIFGASRH